MPENPAHCKSMLCEINIEEGCSVLRIQQAVHTITIIQIKADILYIPLNKMHVMYVLRAKLIYIFGHTFYSGKEICLMFGVMFFHFASECFVNESHKT